MPARLIRSAIALTLVLACFAPAARAWPSLRPGLEVGLLGSRPWIPELPLRIGPEPNVAFGFSAAGTIGFGIPYGLAIETGLRYSRDVDDRDVDFTLGLGGTATTYRGTTTTKFQRLGIPVRLLAGLPGDRGFSVEASAEPQYLLRADASSDVTTGLAPAPAARMARGPAARTANIFEDVGTYEGDVTDMLPRWNLMLGGGLGWEFALARTTAVVRGRFQQSVTDQSKSAEARIYPRVVELSFGLCW